MKTTRAAFYLVIALLLGLGATRSQAADPTDTVFNGQVINSTYTFTNIGVSGTTATLNQTTISNLNGVVPPVSLQLVLSSMTYTDTQDTFTGTGAAPSITFDLVPTLQMVGNLPSTQVTLTAPVLASGQSATNLVFTLASPVTFPFETEMNPGNLDSGTGTFTESLSNLEPTPETLTLSGVTTQNGQPIQVNNQDFNFGGTVEIVYAAPEPHAGWLALLAGLGFAGLVRLRRVIE